MTDAFSTLPSTFWIVAGPAIAVFLWLGIARGRFYLRFFQQEEYDGPRFLAWMGTNRAFDITASLGLIAAFALIAVGDASGLPWLETLGAIFLPIGGLTGILRTRAYRNAKKPLIMTQRARRILNVYTVLADLLLLAGTAVVIYAYGRTPVFSGAAWAALLAVVWVQLLPLLLVLANALLSPAEKRVKAGFRAEAVEKLSRLNPTVIGITGSFGKTSTKHILGHILSAYAPTLMTPGSVNTEMGITRIIREKLTPDIRYFIVEMGAYGPGSIARLCRLAPPDTAIITAVGDAHYERFKSLAAVAQTKFELAEATFEKGGTVTVNRDGVPADLLAEQTGRRQGHYQFVGQAPAPENDITLKDIALTADGLCLHLMDGDEDITLDVPIYGRPQAGNIAAAAATARRLGMPWAAIKAALKTMPQVKHRLDVTKTPDGIAIIDDAYNSNPIGFAAGLECLDALRKEGGRRILITPGMVELGERHDSEHERLGHLAAKHCDIIAVVTPERIPSFVDALADAGNSGAITVKSFTEQADAENWVRSTWGEGDAVLFENNLPDLYETKIRL